MFHYSSLYLIENREIIRVMLPLLTISGRIKILSSRCWNFILFFGDEWLHNIFYPPAVEILSFRC